jgi:hypothetical protein
MPHPPSISTVPLATLVLDPEVLRQALIAALSDATVLAHLSASLRTATGPTATATTFMSTEEYAAHARMSRRSLDLARPSMTEGVHYSRNGRRVRYHVAAADEFLSQQGREQTTAAASETNLKELARLEAARRRPKPSKGSP